MVVRFRAWEKARLRGEPPPEGAGRASSSRLAATFDRANPEWLDGGPEHDELRLKLALVKTTFARFDRGLCHHLVYRGWWLAGCSIATFHWDFIHELPSWRPLRDEA